jgi:hypothetical protein
LLCELLLLIDKKESKQLIVKAIIATVVISSIIVVFDTFNSLREVRMTKQIPKRLEDAFKICGALSLGGIYYCCVRMMDF